MSNLPVGIDGSIDIFQDGGVDSLQVLGLATSLAHAVSIVAVVLERLGDRAWRRLGICRDWQRFSARW